MRSGTVTSPLCLSLQSSGGLAWLPNSWRCWRNSQRGRGDSLWICLCNMNMYKRLGYSVYRTVIEYYSASNGEPDEDADDMSIIPLPHPVRPEDIE
ncbi:N-alpha-acetyltransferase 20-like [Parambassis ranga]|uniref:N-alpha-acetyltransferase 20-like n=1 Tax=Parambassis ranga TaxID=210632 RepID=A0A6P7H8N8_9TELE|nr:N-alpha-acetyltransferase 20-like [Parambassis ranga]